MFQYKLVSTDLEDDLLEYEIIIAPEGMVLKDGVLMWTPDSDQIGDHIVLIEVTDNKSSRQQLFKQTVEDKEIPPPSSGGGVDVLLMRFIDQTNIQNHTFDIVLARTVQNWQLSVEKMGDFAFSCGNLLQASVVK